MVRVLEPIRILMCRSMKKDRNAALGGPALDSGTRLKACLGAATKRAGGFCRWFVESERRESVKSRNVRRGGRRSVSGRGRLASHRCEWRPFVPNFLIHAQGRY